MFSQSIIQTFVDGLVYFATDLLLPLMCLIFVMAVIFRVLIYFTIKREDWFAREFEKRVHAFMDGPLEQVKFWSFFIHMKTLLEKTYYEIFEVRAIMKRRKPDVVMTVSDRIFLIQHGVAWLVNDTLKKIKYLKYGTERPRLLDISKNVFQNNPCFRKVFGLIPVGPVSDVLNVLPGMFIIGGIFGTFLGIMKALPELGGMDLNDVEGTKMIMDNFLLKISFSMSTSIIGIVLSVSMTLVNTLTSHEKLFVSIVERFENTLDTLWNRCENNELPENIVEFEGPKDPLEAMAAEALKNQLSKSQLGIKKNNPNIEMVDEEDVEESDDVEYEYEEEEEFDEEAS
ncbi:MAG: hypothetical protein ISR65_08965 [Bacteriovoracaceae bacterium]|nr:hypothetical protein [Bacteriovoracaceae bacterium]